MSKKITINKDEEIELTEREQDIYKQGYTDGHTTGFFLCAGIIMGIMIITILIKELTK